MNSESILTKEALLLKVNTLLSPILSPRQPITAIESSFARLDSHEDCLFILHWAEVIAVSNIELSYVFCAEVGEARSQLDLEGIRDWINTSLSVYDREGLYPASKVLSNVGVFITQYITKKTSCYLEEVKPHLDIFIRGLVGRDLFIKSSENAYTDTQYLYLPKVISRYKDKNKNKVLFKSIACFLWAQTWYGTFRRRDYHQCGTQDRLDSYHEKERAKEIFLVLENIRLLANIKRDLPGLYREMSLLSPLGLPKDKTWKVIAKGLEKEQASVEDSFLALDKLLKTRFVLPNTAYQGVINASESDRVIDQRKDELGLELKDIIESDSSFESQELSYVFEELSGNEADDGDGGEGEELGDGDLDRPFDQTQTINKELKALIESLLQDVENIEIDDLDISTSTSEREIEGKVHETPEKIKKIDSKYLIEWDYLRNNYRKEWCNLKTREILAVESTFKQETNQKYPFIVSRIRKLFEAMRDQPRMANKQKDGEDIDFDAVVEMVTARQAGEELSERMYIRRLNIERSVAVYILVDMSGSTKGWINLAMRESLILFSEALNTLGDQFAIYGFSGLTRQRCEMYTVKKFSDSFSDDINYRIANIQARDYTRMGFAIRSATETLSSNSCKHRILLILSDGKPDDYDGYQGEYGIQDTRKAIQEAEGQSIQPFCITIDKQAQAYLPRLFGPGRYIILNDVTALPLKLSEIYQKLSA